MARYSDNHVSTVSMENLVPEEEQFAVYENLEFSELGESQNVVDSIAGLENIFLKLESISTEQLEIPAIKVSLENRLEDIKRLLRGTGINISSTSVSQEGFFKSIGSVIKWLLEQFKKIWNWIVEKVKWIFNYNTARNTVNDQAVKDIKKVISTRTPSSDNKQKDDKGGDAKTKPPTKIVVPCPYTCYTYFHTPDWKPQAGYTFNENNVLKSIEGVKKGINRIGNAIEEAVNNFTALAESILNNVDAGKRVTSNDTQRHVKRGQLGQLIDGKFDMLGFRIEADAGKETNPYIKEYPKLVPVLDENGWKTKESFFDITIAISSVEKLAEAMKEQGKIVSAESKSIMDNLRSKQVLKRLKDFKLDKGVNDFNLREDEFTSTLDEESRRNILWNARALGQCHDAVRSVQVLVEKYEFFLNQYHANNTAILVGLRKQYMQAV